MIENWVNWEIWARRALSSRGGWVGQVASVGASVMHACGTLTRLGRTWPGDRGRDTGFKLIEGAGGPRCLQRSVRLYRYYLPVCENERRAGASGRSCLPAAELAEVELEEFCVASSAHRASWATW
jgi:hypothetical protein